jgi:Zn-dependent membrane protease YugP
MFFTPLIYLGIAMLAVVVLFDLVTLPVEINASRRAKQYLASTGTYTSEELEGASKVLNAAALTYLAATLAGILQLIRLLAAARRD